MPEFWEGACSCPPCLHYEPYQKPEVSVMSISQMSNLKHRGFYCPGQGKTANNGVAMSDTDLECYLLNQSTYSVCSAQLLSNLSKYLNINDRIQSSQEQDQSTWVK